LSGDFRGDSSDVESERVMVTKSFLFLEKNMK